MTCSLLVSPNDFKMGAILSRLASLLALLWELEVFFSMLILTTGLSPPLVPQQRSRLQPPPHQKKEKNESLSELSVFFGSPTPQPTLSSPAPPPPTTGLRFSPSIRREAAWPAGAGDLRELRLPRLPPRRGEAPGGQVGRGAAQRDGRGGGRGCQLPSLCHTLQGVLEDHGLTGGSVPAQTPGPKSQIRVDGPPRKPCNDTIPL